MDVEMRRFRVVLLLLWLCPKCNSAFVTTARQPSDAADTFPRNFLSPVDGRILFESVSTCGTKPPSFVLAKQALVCENLKAFRECIGLENDAPVFTSRKCSGHKCLIELDEKGSACFLDHFGYGVKANTNGKDCGLDPTDADLLTSGIRLARLDCASIISSDILSLLRVKCIKGVPLVEMELIFPRYLSDGHFSCEIRPSCTKGFLLSWIVCHTSMQSFLVPLSETLLFENYAAPDTVGAVLFSWMGAALLFFLILD